MKRVIILLICISLSMVAAAQTYVGTMTIGSYTQKNVTAELTIRGDRASLFVRKVKFARMMPVKVDVTFDSIIVILPTPTPHADAPRVQPDPELRAENIVPLSGGRRWTKYTVTHGRGYAGQTCVFCCTMNGKEVEFKGTRQ